MAYPSTTLVGCSWDSTLGVPTPPTGWRLTLTWKRGSDYQTTIYPDFAGRSWSLYGFNLQPPDGAGGYQDWTKDPSLMGAYDGRLIGQTYKAIQDTLCSLEWIASNGKFGAYAGILVMGTLAQNLIEPATFYGTCSGDGTVLTLQCNVEGYENPLDITKNLLFTPAGESESGSFYWTSGRFGITPGMEVHRAGYDYSEKAIIKPNMDVNIAAGTVTLSLTHAMPLVTGGWTVWENWGDYARWDHFQPGRPNATFTDFIGCVHCKYDMGKSLPTSLSWVDEDPNGDRWYCAMAHYGALVSEFNYACEATACPYWQRMTASDMWLPTPLRRRNLVFGQGGMYLEQTLPGAGGGWLQRGFRGAGGHPSMCEIAGAYGTSSGIRKFDTSGLGVKRVDYVGGKLTALDKTTSETKPYYTPLIGYHNVLAKAYDFDPAPSPKDDCLGGGAGYDDGTNAWEQIRTFPECRVPPAKSLIVDEPSVGGMDAYVQRAQPRRIVLEEVDLSASAVDVMQTFLGEGGRYHYAMLGSGNILEVWLTRQHYQPLFEHIPTAAKYIVSYSVSGTELTLRLSVFPDYCVYFSGVGSEGPEVGFSAYLTGGGAVNATESERPYNYGASDLATAAGRLDKVERGRQIRIQGLPNDLDLVAMTVLRAQAFAGPEYTDLPPTAEGPVSYTFLAPGAFMPSAASWPDSATGRTYTPTSVRYGNAGTTNFTGIHELAYGTDQTLDPAYHAYFHRWCGISDGSGQVIPSTGYGDSTASYGIWNAIVAYLVGSPTYPALLDPRNLTFSVTYRAEGATEDTTETINLYHAIIGGAGTFYALPCVHLPGEPNLSETMTLSWWSETVGDWVDTEYTFDGIYGSAGAEWNLPPQGHWNIFYRDGGFYALLPLELWGYTCKVDYTRASITLPITIDTNAQGLGFPEGFNDTFEEDGVTIKTKGYRRNTDSVTVSVEGAYGQALLSFLQGLDPFPANTYYIALDSKPVLAPGVTPSAWHVNRASGVETPIAPTAVDSGMGYLAFDVSAWGGGAPDICFEDPMFLECDPKSFPASVVSNMRRTLCVVNTITSGMTGSVGYMATQYIESPRGDRTSGMYWTRKESGAGTFGIEDLWLVGLADDETATDCFVEGGLYPEPNINSFTGFLGSYVWGAGLSWYIGMYTYQAPAAFIGHPEWIQDAWQEISILGATKQSFHWSKAEGEDAVYIEDDPIPLPSGGLSFQAMRVEDYKTLGGTTYKKVSPLGGSPDLGTLLTLYEVTEGENTYLRGMIRVTGPLKKLCEESFDSAKQYVFALMGTGEIAADGGGFRDTVLRSAFPTWTVTYDEGGAVAWNIEYDRYTISEVTFGNLYIECDVEAIAAVAPTAMPEPYPPIVEVATG